jgi:hypothetical protein
VSSDGSCANAGTSKSRKIGMMRNRIRRCIVLPLE